jgi:hypothetical protein
MFADTLQVGALRPMLDTIERAGRAASNRGFPVPARIRMPVSWEVDADRGQIRTHCSADTTFEEVMSHLRELRSLPALPRPLDVFLDLRDIRNLPTLDQLETVAGTTGALTPDLGWGAMAIVATSDVVFGTSRIYEALVHHYFEDVRVFRDPVEADAWIDGVQAARAAGSTRR